MSKENKCTCGTCKHYSSDNCYCMARGEFELYEEDTCDNWEDDNEPTEEEKRINAGDVEAHRRMVEGDDLL